MKAIKNYNEKLGPFIPYAKKIIMFDIKEDFRDKYPIKRKQGLNLEERQRKLSEIIDRENIVLPPDTELKEALLEYEKDKRTDKMRNKTLKEIKKVIQNRRKRIERTLK